MQTLSLNGDWHVAHCPDGEGNPGDLDGLEWLPAKVPGEAHLDLMRADRLEDPFYDLNHIRARDLESEEFWYRRAFDVPTEMAAERLEMVFEGLDCFATVWINGTVVGESANALVPQAFDVTNAIGAGRTNEIRVRLGSPIRAVEGKDTTGCEAAPNAPERLWARKSGQCYGWDIAPRLVTVGIWRSVTLASHSRAILRSFFLKTDSIAPNGSSALVTLEAEVEALSAQGHDLSIRASAECGDSRFELTGPVRDGRALLTAEVSNPRLWWTWDLGRPSLYDLTVTLLDGADNVDAATVRTGIRTVRLIEEPEGGRERSFVFELNGIRFFSRGLNWTPCDSLYPRAEPWKQQRLVRFARELNVNMLRVWGGGIYEPDTFYEECDEQGIAIFHDFLYACAIYPQSQEFLDIARDEAETAIRRLRNHPSILLWCGDNEIDWAYTSRLGPRDPWDENKISREVIPAAIERLDGTRPYIPSSPYSPDRSIEPNDMRQGDQHIWHHGMPFQDDVYLKSGSRFVSEIGHLSCPDLQTVTDMLAPEHRWPPDNRAWDEHFGDHYHLDARYHRREKMDAALAAWLGAVPDDLATYVAATQLLQGEACKAWAECWRLRKARWEAGGILLWNLADCWPGFSDAIVDFHLRPKLACNYIRAAYEPLHVCFSPATADELAAYVINDTLEQPALEYAVKAVSRDGMVLGEIRGEGAALANDVTKLTEAAELYHQAEGERGDVVAELFVGGELVSKNIRRAWKPTVRDITELLSAVPALPCAP